MAGKRVLSVGQCFADHSAIAKVVKQTFDAEVVSARTRSEALTRLREEPFALVLVNRVLDADNSPGLDLVREIKGDETLRATPVIVVSNYEQAQAQAVAAGAEPGFGKNALGMPETAERLRPFLTPEP